MANHKIAILRGDGIGPEITNAAIGVLDAVANRFGHTFEYTFPLIGGEAIDREGAPLPQATIDECLKSDAVLLGAVGGPKWDNLAGHLRPEKGLLGIRSAMGLYANVRPAVLYDELKSSSPLKNDIIKNGVDITVVRELTGGIYFGERTLATDENGEIYATDTEKYSVSEIERITKIACKLAVKRSGKIASVDKANVLETSRLWRKTVHAYCNEHYPEIEVKDVLVDNMAMQLVKNPSQFDVVLTSNMFGDILSDEAAQITGSIGMLASSSLGDGTRGLYEPIHGSAPDIAGTDSANPVATILAAAMMLRDSFGLDTECAAIEKAVQTVLEKGYRTADIMQPGMKKIGCAETAQRIADEI